MTNRQSEIVSLALALLEDAEMQRTSADSLTLKASRLARLVEDEEVSDWLYHERHGYDDHSAVSIKYLNLTNRWIDVKEKKGLLRWDFRSGGGS